MTSYNYIRLSLAFFMALSLFPASGKGDDGKKGKTPLQIPLVVEPGEVVRIRVTFSRLGRNDDTREQSVLVTDARTGQLLHGFNNQFSNRWEWEHAGAGGGDWVFENTGSDARVLNICAEHKSAPRADIEWVVNPYKIVYQKAESAYVGWSDGPSTASEMRDEVVEVNFLKKRK
jgi:hypothetical protein